MTLESGQNCGNSEEVFDFRKKPAGYNPTTYVLNRPVFFVGFMGAGKTSVARKLARMASVASMDLDAYIERHCDKKISDIFAESGEEAFRSIETNLLDELAEGDPQLIACGGGIVLASRNREILKDRGYVVYLKVTADEAAGRISDTSTRPLFNDLESARKTMAGRLPLYESVADLTVDTAGRSTGSLAYDIFETLKKEGVLCQQK